MFFLTLYFLEFKNRVKLIISGLLFVIALFIAYKETLLYILIKPTISNLSLNSKSYLICTNITDGFTTYWNIIMILYLHYILFFLFYNAYFFFVPGLYNQERKFLSDFISIYLLIYIFLVLLFYNYLLPTSWNFFFKFNDMYFDFNLPQHNKEVKLFFEITLKHYVEFFFSLYFFLLIFIQLYILLMHKLIKIYKKVKFKALYRKQIYFLFLVLSTLITPPDILSQIIFGSTFILVLELTIFIIIFKNKV